MIQLSGSWTSLCLLTALQGLAIFLFASGFFLTRLELPNASPCDPSSLLEAINATDLWVGRRGGNHGEVAGCWGPRYYARVVVLLVDGLRYDFVAPTARTPPPPSTPRTEASNPMPKNSEDQSTMVNVSKPPHSHPPLPLYLDRMPTVKALLDRDPTRARLAVFEADPPTTTSQRLKGLTTGGMPTFLDLRKNFNSPAVSEDSWIGQLNAAAARAAHYPEEATKSDTRTKHRHFDGSGSNSHSWGWGALLLGDDTWTSLYPNHFDAKTSMPMSSFDTRDLHTVDDAVSLRLGPTIDAVMKQEDSGASFPTNEPDTAPNAHPVPPKGISPPTSQSWAVLIAHFLGVDHVGHTHRADHPVMAAKLTQMDEILRSTVAQLEAVYPALAAFRHNASRNNNCTKRNDAMGNNWCNVSNWNDTKNDEATRTCRSSCASTQDDYRIEEQSSNEGPTLVLIFGDHGMTDDGNHGGATESETHAGFFAWEARPDSMTSLLDTHLENKDTNTDQNLSSNNSSGSRPRSTLRCFSAFASKIWDDVNGWGNNSNTSLNADARRAILAQVDLVPTLSLLLGLPVPASSLGGVWPELLTLPAVEANIRNRFNQMNSNASTSSSTSSLNSSTMNSVSRPARVPWSQHPLSQALLVNAAQVWAYLLAYDAASMGFPEGVLAPLQQQLYIALDAHRRLGAAETVAEEAGKVNGNLGMEEQTQADAEAEKDVEALWLAYRAFLGATLALGRRLFTRFDGSLMASGLMMLSVAVVAAVVLLFCTLHRAAVALSVKSVREIGGLSVAKSDIASSSLWFLRNFQPSITAITAIAKLVIIPVGCCLLHTCGRFANSFVESEAVVLCFLNSTAALATGIYAATGEGVTHTSKSTSEPFKPRVSAFVWALVAAGAVRLTAPRGALRASSGFDPLLTDSSVRASCNAEATEEIGSHSSEHCLSQESSTGGAPFLWLLWCSCGALFTLSALCDTYLSDVGAATKGVLTRVDGAVGNSGETGVETRRQQYAQVGRIRRAAAMRKFAYFLLWFIVGCHWQLDRDIALQTLAGESGNDSRRGARPYLELRLLLPRAVFALATLLAASVFFFNHSANAAIEKGVTIVVWRLHRCALVGLAFLPFWTLLVGPSGPSCAIALLIHAVAVVKLSAAFVASSILATPPLMAATPYSRAAAQASGAICAAVLCRLGARYAFHASGHGNTFSDLQLGAAFVGFDNFCAPRAGFLLFINTVGAEVLWTAAVLPTALAAVVLSTANSSQVPPLHLDRGPSSPAAAKPKAERATAVAGSAAATVAAAPAVVEIGLYASAVLQAIDGLATVMAVAVHRRHLMVWAVFAPKLVLDAALHAAHASALLFSAWPCSLSKT